MSEPPLLDRKVDVPTLILYGMDDQVIGPGFPAHLRSGVHQPRRAGLVPGAGHFLQWERADVVNPLVTAFLGDLRVRHRR